MLLQEAVAAAHRSVWDRFVHADSDLLYDFHPDLAEYPTAQEIAADCPNSAGWATGLEDCAFNGSTLLCGLLLGAEHTGSADMAAKARRMLTVHFNQRFSPEAHFVKGLAERGELGEIYIGKCLWVRRRGIPARRSFYQKASSGGGALIDIGVHVLDLTMWLMGHPEPVAVSGCTYGHFGPDVDPAFDVDDHAVAFVRFGNGAALTLEASWASHVEGEAIGFELRGTRGGARRTGSYAGDYRIFQTLGDVCVDVTPCAPLPPVANAQHQFAASVLHGTPNPAPGEDGLAVQRVLEAIYKSAASGREVRLAPTAARRKRG